ncbi:MAG: tetratricopeptide repeat protein, partial [Chromatocurvus sp.]
LVLAARAEQGNGRNEAAQSHIEEARTLRDDIAVRKMLVENLLQQDKLDAAREQIEALPDAERTAPAAQLLLGRIAMAQERYSEAESLFQPLFDAQGDGVSLAYLTGSLWAQGQREEAIAHLESWLADNPENVELRNQLAARYLTMGNEDAARKEYRRLVEAVPNSPMVLNNLAWLERERNSDEALEYVKRALEIAPDSIQIIDTYAMVELARGNHEAALEFSARALDAAPEATALQLNRAVVLVGAGRTDEARELLDTLLSGPASPQHEEARELLATLDG